MAVPPPTGGPLVARNLAREMEVVLSGTSSPYTDEVAGCGHMHTHDHHHQLTIMIAYQQHAYQKHA